MSKAIIYFVKLPKPGFNKTRLQGFLPKEDIHHLTIYLLQKNFNHIKNSPADIFLYVTPEEDKLKIKDYIDVNQLQVRGQAKSPHLGKRMFAAMSEVFKEGYEEVALLGCDLFNMSTEIIEEAFNLLSNHDLVLTPTEDGGYGLIASKIDSPIPFSLDEYSHDKVCQETLAAAKKAGFLTALTQQIYDIDTRDDVARALSNDSSAVFFNQGEYNANFLIEEGKKLLRIALGSQMSLDNQIEYEYKALKGLQSSGVVAEVYNYEPETELLGKGFLVQEYLPGRPLNYTTDLVKAAELLAKVHSVDTDQTPHLIRASQPFQVMYDEFLTMFSHYQKWEEAEEKVIRKIEYLLKNLHDYNLNQPLENACVINTELNSHNFIIGSSASYIIDWEKPLIGEREQDLAHFLAPTTTLWRTDILLSPEQIKDFVKSYNSFSHIPVNELKLQQYLHFTCLRGITWCAMAYRQYIEASKVKSDDRTFEVIKKFISIPFLNMIDQYIEELTGVINV